MRVFNNRSEFATAAGITDAAVNEWTSRSGGILSGRPRDTLTSLDLAVTILYQELKVLLGPRSTEAQQYCRELAPRVHGAPPRIEDWCDQIRYFGCNSFRSHT